VGSVFDVTARSCGARRDDGNTLGLCRVSDAARPEPVYDHQGEFHRASARL